jgi:hypothetical protein
VKGISQTVGCRNEIGGDKKLHVERRAIKTIMAEIGALPMVPNPYLQYCAICARFCGNRHSYESYPLGSWVLNFMHVNSYGYSFARLEVSAAFLDKDITTPTIARSC